MNHMLMMNIFFFKFFCWESGNDEHKSKKESHANEHKSNNTSES